MARRGRKGSPQKLQNMKPDTSPQMGGLGESWLNEGKVLGRTTKAGMTIRYENAACSCYGENSNCFKCDGTGYYRREVVEKMRSKPLISAPRLCGESSCLFDSENQFSNDARGGDYGIRESGRFSSNPLHDDHDN